MVYFKMATDHFVHKNKILPFGETLLDYLALDIPFLKERYKSGCIQNYDSDNYRDYITEIVSELCAFHPFFELFKDQFLSSYPFYTFNAKSQEDLDAAFYSTLQDVFDHYIEIQTKMSDALNYFLMSDDDLTPPMRLLVYMYEIYDGTPLENLAPESETVFPEDFPEEASVAELNDYVKKYDLKLKEVFSFKTIEQICVYELIKTINLNMNVKKCKFCGSFFLPKSRSDTEYCDRIKPGEAKSCAEIGPMRIYQDKTKESPVYAIYNKAYKRNNSRVRSKKITQSEFLAWSDQAREKRDLALDGKMSLLEFESWCNSSR